MTDLHNEPASSPLLNRPPRTQAQAARDIAARKALHLEPMTEAELALLTVGELVEVSDRARNNAAGLEADNTCWLKGNGSHVRALGKLARAARAELARRADQNPTVE